MLVTNKDEAREQREDRLSSLPDDILIAILNCLPLKLSIVTGCLSLRWKGLWTNLNSFHMNRRDFESLTELITAIDEIATQITSPFIHSFSVRFENVKSRSVWQQSMDRWLRKICDRNISELKVRRSDNFGWLSDLLRREDIRIPSYIFQTQSLASVELDLTIGLPLDGDADTINLPNLKNLRLIHSSSHCEWLEKLIKACPSLEELSLNHDRPFVGRRQHIKCSNKNLRRLLIKLGPDNELVIDAPKLEYLDIHSSKSTTFCFKENPVLCEMKMKSFDLFLSKYEKKAKSKFDQAVKDMASRVFHNVIRLTLDKKMFHNINNFLTLEELCPALECLTLQVWDISEDLNLRVLSIPAIKLPRVLKRIEIETYCKVTNFLMELVEYLFRAINLEQFCLSIVGSVFERAGIEYKQTELELCKLLYHSSIVSMGREIKFVGKIFKMSSKAGPKAWSRNGEIILLN